MKTNNLTCAHSPGERFAAPRWRMVGLAIAWGWFFVNSMALGQQEDPTPSLASKQSAVDERFARLELLAGRLAELSRATQPRRAELLTQLLARSRERELDKRFDAAVAALEQDRLAEALELQTGLQTDLQAMLELLLQEDRDRQIESERKRIAKYLAELNKLIRQQRGIKARTQGGDAHQRLADDQQRTADAAQQLRDEIARTEGTTPDASHGKETDKSDASARESSGDQSPGSKPSPSSTPKSSSGEPGSPAQGTPSEGTPSQGSPSAGSASGKSQSSGQQSPSKPADRAVNRLQQARSRMQQAREKLEQAQQDRAVDDQQSALRELEQAKAELEKILRQLREEEMERVLVMLEARLRKMLEAQNQVYDQTMQLDKSKERTAEHEMEIASATLSRREDQIINEADRALLLLREDGSSVAFPEAIQQAREDMVTVSQRLRNVQPEKITQALEEDIIATLEETLAALQQALKELRDQKSSQQSAGGEPGEQPLVDQLAELRMIRALQNRVNRRTTFYDSLIEGKRALETDLLEALDRLAVRQEHIFQATRDLNQGANR